MSNSTEPTPNSDIPEGTEATETSRSFRDRIAEIPERRRSFLAGLAVGAAVLGGAWGVTSAFDGGSDGHHRGGDMMQMRDHGDDKMPMHDHHDGRPGR